MSTCDTAYETTTSLYLGYDNAVTLVPYSDIADRVYYDMTNVTLVTVIADSTDSTATGDGITALSTDDPQVISFSQVGTTTEWRINVKVGLFTGITAGTYKLRVIAAEPAHPNGLVLTDSVQVTIVDIP
jgi:hypothetical protein